MIKITKAPEKKITGSRFAAVVGRSEFKTEFEAWAEIMGVHKVKIDNVFIDFGNKFETKLLTYAKKTLGTFERPDKKKCNYDYFPENERFGGIPDGILPEGITIEAKLTHIKNYDKWKNDDAALKQYLYQLYNYQTLVNAKWNVDVQKVIFVVGFYTDDELIDMKWGAKKANTIIKEIDFNKELAEAAFKEANDWYDRHILTGESPEPKTKDDIKIANGIREFIANATIEFTEEINDDIEEYLSLKDKVKDDNKRIEELKDKLKLNLAGKDAAVGGTKFLYCNSTYERANWDKSKFEKENPDLFEKYIKKSTVVSRLIVKEI